MEKLEKIKDDIANKTVNAVGNFADLLGEKIKYFTESPDTNKLRRFVGNGLNKIGDKFYSHYVTTGTTCSTNKERVK